MTNTSDDRMIWGLRCSFSWISTTIAVNANIILFSGWIPGHLRIEYTITPLNRFIPTPDFKRPWGNGAPHGYHTVPTAVVSQGTLTTNHLISKRFTDQWHHQFQPCEPTSSSPGTVEDGGVLKCNLEGAKDRSVPLLPDNPLCKESTATPSEHRYPW